MLVVDLDAHRSRMSLLMLLQQLLVPLPASLRTTVKLMSLLSSRPMDCKMMSTLILFVGQQGEDLEGHARAIAGRPTRASRATSLSLATPLDMRFFHIFHDLLHVGAGITGEAGQHFQIHIDTASPFPRCGCGAPCAPRRSQLQHLVISDLIQLLRRGHLAGVSGVNAVHIGVDLALVCPQRRSQRHGGGVGCRRAPAWSRPPTC